MCNTHIKWEALLKRADQLGCEYIATGHYAQVREENGRYVVSKGIDRMERPILCIVGAFTRVFEQNYFPYGTIPQRRY